MCELHRPTARHCDLLWLVCHRSSGFRILRYGLAFELIARKRLCCWTGLSVCSCFPPTSSPTLFWGKIATRGSATLQPTIPKDLPIDRDLALSCCLARRETFSLAFTRATQGKRRTCCHAARDSFHGFHLLRLSICIDTRTMSDIQSYVMKYERGWFVTAWLVCHEYGAGLSLPRYGHGNGGRPTII